MITYDIDREKWAQVAAECRRLAGLTVDEWMRAELLRSARFYDNLSTGFSRCDLRPAPAAMASRAAN